MSQSALEVSEVFLLHLALKLGLQALVGYLTWMLGPNTGPLQGQQVLLIAPSLQPWC